MYPPIYIFLPIRSPSPQSDHHRLRTTPIRSHLRSSSQFTSYPLDIYTRLVGIVHQYHMDALVVFMIYHLPYIIHLLSTLIIYNLSSILYLLTFLIIYHLLSNLIIYRHLSSTMSLSLPSIYHYLSLPTIYLYLSLTYLPSISIYHHQHPSMIVRTCPHCYSL